MHYYELEPEVAGGWGEGTIANTARHPPVISRLHYRFDGWLGDALVESFPCFIITADLADDLEAAELTGYGLKHVTVTRSEQFQEAYGDLDLPMWRWLDVKGHAGADDFALSEKWTLIVSERALELLEKHGIDNCEVHDRSA